MNQSSGESRKTLIEAVKTPLAFLVLGFLVIDGTVATLAVALSDYRGPLIWTMITSIFVLILIVVGLAVKAPWALRGGSPFEAYASEFATDLFLSIDGALGNLQPAERAEAWLTLADVITRASEKDTEYSTFCLKVAARVQDLTNLQKSTLKTHGPIFSEP